MLKDAMEKNGYNVEEKYFHDESRRQIEAIRKDPLKIRRMLRAIQQKSAEPPVKTGGSSGATAPKKKVA